MNLLIAIQELMYIQYDKQSTISAIPLTSHARLESSNKDVDLYQVTPVRRITPVTWGTWGALRPAKSQRHPFVPLALLPRGNQMRENAGVFSLRKSSSQIASFTRGQNVYRTG